MKVICIDNKYFEYCIDPKAMKKLIEGNVYTASNSLHPLGYFLDEIVTINPAGFLKSRFIPLSEIDEKEFVRDSIVVNN